MKLEGVKYGEKHAQAARKRAATAARKKVSGRKARR
jgi:hypothetical protein